MSTKVSGAAPRRKGLTLTDVLVTVVVSLVLGIVYHLWASVSSVAGLLFLQSNELVYGMWFAASTLAFLLIRKPGVALIAEIAAAHLEIAFGSAYGIQLLLYSVVQGLGAELVFAAFRYRKATAFVAGLAGIAAAAGSLLADIYYGYVTEYATWLLILKYTLRAISGFVIAGYLMYGLAKLLEKAGVTQSLQPVDRKEYDALDS
ncbi:ECF transporter S component [Saccharibacillus kuerlensis]|uniref:HMP/thiamine permease protein YkoE n=1 Tax=Saccharibacillus kuerlensis TaxID=459527 RepID=A0ABQ2L4I5_9BACL|nr:ECF transporter S component [Saccharibacillus kuerlensis]GGO02897.1 putative HMP/thiamine permease protein YkoE [Saccharibacillus kuerlensis]